MSETIVNQYFNDRVEIDHLFVENVVKRLLTLWLNDPKRYYVLNERYNFPSLYYLALEMTETDRRLYADLA